MNHERGHGRIDDASWKSISKDVTEFSYSAQYLLYFICKKLDIPVSEPEVDEPIRPDGEMFMKWYRFYDNHLVKGLSDDQYRAFNQARKNGEDVSQYLPTGDWRETA